MKVYGWTGMRPECKTHHKQTREVVAAPSRAAAARIAGITSRTEIAEIVETRNDAECNLALSSPGEIFWHPLDLPHQWHSTAAHPKPKRGQTIIVSTTMFRGPDDDVYFRVLHAFDEMPAGFRAKLFHQLPFVADASTIRRLRQLPDGRWYQRMFTGADAKLWHSQTTPYDQAPEIT